MTDKRKVAVDSYLTFQREPRITLQMPDGRCHALTIAEIRDMMSDIRSEIEYIHREMEGLNDNGNGSN